MQTSKYSNHRQLYWLEQSIANEQNTNWVYYHAAKSAAKAGESDKAMRYLKHAIATGWQNIPYLENDQDLNNLHDLPEWQSLFDMTNNRTINNA